MIKKESFIITVIITCVLSLLVGFYANKIISKQSNTDATQNQATTDGITEDSKIVSGPIKPYTSFLVNGSDDVVRLLNDNAIDKIYYSKLYQAKSVAEEQDVLNNWNEAYKTEYKNAKNILEKSIKNKSSKSNYDNSILLKTIEDYYSNSSVYSEKTAQLAYDFEEYNLGKGSNHSYDLLLNNLQLNRINTLRLIECIYMLDVDYIWSMK